MLRKIMQTKEDYVATFARLVLGFIMLPHGIGKITTMFGGHGFSATMGMFTNMMHIPWIFALLAIIAEVAGSLGLIFGLFGRIAAFGIAMNMIFAVLLVHIHNGFFMNWMQAPNQGEGYEYHILALAFAAIVMVTGSGAHSLDEKIMRKMN